MVNEGSSVELSGAGSSDEEGDPMTFAWDLDDDGSFESPGVAVTFSRVDGPADHTVTLRVCDPYSCAEDSTTVRVNNVAPTVTLVPGAATNFSGQIHQITATFTDPGLIDTHTTTINWDDGAGDESVTVTQGTGSGSLSGSHQYLAARIYNIIVTVTDNDDDWGSAQQAKTVIRLPVFIDIKPGSDRNSINPGSKGVIPVGVFSGTYADVVFDASTIVGSSLVFEETGIAHGDSHVEDLDGTGSLDSVSHYRTQATSLTDSSVEGCLTGATGGGIEFAGCDSVRIVPPGNSNAGGSGGPAPSSVGGSGKGKK